MKLKWKGDAKFSPLYGDLKSGTVFECGNETHAKRFIESGKAEKVNETTLTKEKDK